MDCLSSAQRFLADHDGDTELREAVQMLVDSAERQRVQEHLSAAIEAGLERGPRAIDIFVHVNWPWASQLNMLGMARDVLWRKAGDVLALQEDCIRLLAATRAEYGERIALLLEQAATGIVLTCESEDNVPSRHHLAVTTPPFADGVEQGCAAAEDVPALLAITQGLHVHDCLRVHGAAYKQCTLMQAMQQFALRYGIFLPPHQQQQENTPLYQSTLCVIRAIRNSAMVRCSGIRMGTVFDVANMYDQRSRDPWCDDDTVILPWEGSAYVQGLNSRTRSA